MRRTVSGIRHFAAGSLCLLSLAGMPEISRYLGIRVFIRYRDHPPPHFHVRYGEDSAIIAIETMQILEGRFPARVYGLITEWGMLHRALLRENWRRAMAREPLLSIPPLEV